MLPRSLILVEALGPSGKPRGWQPSLVKWPMAARPRLLLAAVLLLVASSLAAAQAGSDACGPDCSSVYLPDLFKACLLNVSGTVVFPDTDFEAWDDARRCGALQTCRRRRCRNRAFPPPAAARCLLQPVLFSPVT